MAAGNHKQRKVRNVRTQQVRTLTEVVDQIRETGYSRVIPSWQHYTAKRDAKISRKDNLRDGEA